MRFVLSVHFSTCFNWMSKCKDRENIDCYCSEKSTQNHLEMPPMVKLVEICRLRAFGWISLLNFLFTLNIRKILVRLRTMRTPCIRERSHKKTNCIVSATAGGSGANNTEISLPPHWKLKLLVFEYINNFRFTSSNVKSWFEFCFKTRHVDLGELPWIRGGFRRKNPVKVWSVFNHTPLKLLFRKTIYPYFFFQK